MSLTHFSILPTALSLAPISCHQTPRAMSPHWSCVASFVGLYALHKDYKVAHQSFIQHCEPTPLTIQDLGDWTSFFIGLQRRHFWVSTPSIRIIRSRTNPLLNMYTSIFLHFFLLFFAFYERFMFCLSLPTNKKYFQEYIWPMLTQQLRNARL